MFIRTLRPVLALIVALTPLLFAGCNPAQPVSSTMDRANPDQPAQAAQTQSIAEAALGKQAEVLAQGDLARNGLEQVLVVNRLAHARTSDAGAASPAAILILRAAILEKRDANWSEVLRCDERLKNPNGYLAGSPRARVSGWRLEYIQDPARGLEMKFTPAPIDADAQGSGSSESPGPAVAVGWNAKAKRYQSLDQSHERYLSEVPTLETPYSILK